MNRPDYEYEPLYVSPTWVAAIAVFLAMLILIERTAV